MDKDHNNVYFFKRPENMAPCRQITDKIQRGHAMLIPTISPAACAHFLDKCRSAATTKSDLVTGEYANQPAVE